MQDCEVGGDALDLRRIDEDTAAEPKLVTDIRVPVAKVPVGYVQALITYFANTF